MLVLHGKGMHLWGVPNEPTMQQVLLTLLFTVFLLTCVRAQDHFEGIDYVQGPEYVVYDHPAGPIVYWDDVPAAATQLRTTEEGIIEVLPPGTTTPRLLIYLTANQRVAKVIDLEYSRDPRLPSKPVTAVDYDAAGPIEVSFSNGLEFTYADGQASASLGGTPIPVTGEKGRYRIDTDEFEAGVAFGPEYGTQVYQYLRVK